MASAKTIENDALAGHAYEQSRGIGVAGSKDLKQSSISDKTQPSAARITEIDISGPARALAVLRWSDYTLVVVCGLGALGMLPDLVAAAFNAQWSDLVVQGAMAATFAFAAYTGWRHVGVIDQRVWQSYLWVFPLLATVTVVLALEVAMVSLSQGKPFDDTHSWLSLWGYLWLAGGAIPGFVCVLLLYRMRIAPTGVRLDELLAGLTERSGISGLGLARIQRTGVQRGLTYGIVGATVLLGATFWPLPTEWQQASNTLRVIQQLNVLGFFLLVRARRYFQVSADSLLAVDKRPPILFLRSFSDDEKQQYGNSQRALLDFSLETRLANHFHRFGPFIAIGSPKETVPQPGAARVLLADNEWQPRVLGWMKDSSVIIMYSGTTEWVNWELRKVVESGRSTNLILMFPEIKGWRASRRNRDIAARVEHIRDVFKDTPWNEELMEFSDFSCLRAMLFRADGSMVMIKSRSRSRDAYHLAALIAHQQLLDPMATSQGAMMPVDTPWLPWKTVLAWAFTGGAALFVVIYLLGLNHGTRLTFKQGELYYNEPVTQADARNIGEYLVQQQYFSDQKAVTVQLDQEQGRYRLGFVIDPARADDRLAVIQFGVMGSDIAREALGGKPIEVALYDEHLKLIKVVPASTKLSFGQGELYYTDPITMDEARGVGEYLVRQQFFSDQKAATVQLGQEQGTYQLRFVIDPSRAADLEVLDAFSELSRAIAKEALGGQSVVVHLCDEEFHTLKRIE